MRIRTIGLALLSVCLSSSCWYNEQEDYCANLLKLANEPEIRQYLISWVNENVSGKNIDPDSIWPGGAGPGRRWLEANPDLAILGFEQYARVHLIGDDPANFYSVFFGERSNQGILVKTMNSEKFGVDMNSITLVSDDIAVICDHR